ncbi:MAG: efflux RND transporter periplasmic adaptor subunit [Candidatus Loosdrechtia sp.]|uniref:efflux RND transporter periplasmic adaptor subunit n=1 Tax=Candidatus Loosdrechtia sp. TaxID=3101272 RepID=UPI003A5E5F98|nr:MAG: efflux RND transporter periplasmic adaptor subunit [Candidatus Jettenia sp. AMX2]
MLNNINFKNIYNIALVTMAMLVMVFTGGCGEELPVEMKVRAVVVEVAEVRTETFERRVRGIGTLRAVQSVEVAGEAEGLVEQILFREGQTVEEGELLVVVRGEKLRMRLASAQASLKGAESELEYAGQTYERFSKLHKDGAVSVEDYERQRAAFLSALAMVEGINADILLIEEQINDTMVRAPFSGTLSVRMVDIGDFVRPGQPLVRLFSRELEMTFALPERYIGEVEYGQAVEIMVAAYPDRRFGAETTFISPDIDEATRNFTVKARLGNKDGLLKPGGFATAVVTVEVLEDKPAVPENALIGTQVGYKVFVVADNIAYEREVEVGLRRPGTAQVIRGVSPGDKVVSAGHIDLRDGSRVKIVQGDPGNTLRGVRQ